MSHHMFRTKYTQISFINALCHKNELCILAAAVLHDCLLHGVLLCCPEQRMRCVSQVEQAEKAAQDAMFHNFFQWKKEMDASDGTKPLMIPLYPPARTCRLPNLATKL